MPHREFTGPDGKSWPSVTGIIDEHAKPFLYRWYGTKGWNECERIKKEAAKFGTRVHDLIDKKLGGNEAHESHADGGFNGGPRLEETLAGAAIEWARKEKLVFEAMELHCWHASLRYHGTLDAIVRKPSGKRYILDWKCSNYVSDDWPLQLAAYAAAYNYQNRLTGKDAIRGGIICRLDKRLAGSGGKSVCPVEYTDLRGPFKAFKGLLDVAWWKRERK